MMKELYKILPNKGDRGFTIQLANGDIDVPNNPDCYVISTGCGSGKTESIKSLIRQKYEDGIMYCVNSISELQKMHTWILENLCGTGLSREDVVCISSDWLDRDDLRAYRDNPSLLTKKKIVLLTHVRFWSDLINYFLVYHPISTTDEPIFDGDFQKLMARKDLRAYTIFDETPTFIKPFVTLPKFILGVFGEKDKAGKWICCDRNEMDESYDKFLKGTKHSFFKEDTKLNLIKREVVLNLIPSLYDRWMLTKQDELPITFTPMDLYQKNINTHVLIYEGAGDVLFCGSENYRVLDVKEKYDSQIKFEKRSIYKKRYDTYTDLEIRATANELSKIVNETDGNTLVVVWQSIGKNARDDENKDNSCFVDEVKARMKIAPDKTYEITYFGSAKTKSTNEFRDFKNIVLWGRWSITKQDTGRFQECYGTSTSNLAHQVWYYIQLLCRIGVRKHEVKGMTYRVFYTSDYDEKLIDALDQYFNHNKNIVKPETTPLEKKLAKSSVDKRVIPKIIELAKTDPEIEKAIRSNKPYAVNFSAHDIYTIISIGSKPKKDNYEGLINNLRKVNINLTVT